jgi:predicted phage-related endonuclease
MASRSPAQRGRELEAEARRAYIRKTGIPMTPVCVQHERYSWLRASLDGWNADQKIPLEVKCPGRKDHLEALTGRVPGKYIPQVQHILMVTGAKELHYFSYDGQDGVTVVVAADPAYQKRLFEAELAFWNSVQAGTPPFSEQEEISSQSLEPSEGVTNPIQSRIGVTIPSSEVPNAIIQARSTEIIAGKLSLDGRRQMLGKRNWLKRFMIRLFS